MSVRVNAVLVVCAQALLLKSALGQTCTSRAAVADYSGFGPCGLATSGLAAPCGLAALGASFAGRGLPFDGPVAGCAGSLAYDGMYASTLEITPTSGGALLVSSASTIAPIGVSVLSDNVYEGAVAVGGEMPFVGTVALEGVVPSAGAGDINHACGNGRNAMISEASAFGPVSAYGPAAAFAPNAFASRFGASPFGYGVGVGRECGCPC